MSRTINLAPTWESAARIYIEVLKNSDSVEAQAAAEEDMMRLARNFDRTQTDEYKVALNAVLHAASDYAAVCAADDSLTEEELIGIHLSIEHLGGVK